MVRVVIVGAHGRVAQQLMRLLYDGGDEIVGIVRNEEHADDVYRLGGEGVLLDIETATEDELAAAFEGADVVVFSAGAGVGSGVERKRTVDYAGSVKAAVAAERAGIRRFIQVSAHGVDSPVAPDADEVWAAYVTAKRDADAALRESSLAWTILRPGSLTSEGGTGRVTLGPDVARGSISREDVAATIVAAIAEPRSAGHTWELVAGDVPITQAVRDQLDAVTT
jgi:uncharacterized protein YbjT (DUF2867 family)